MCSPNAIYAIYIYKILIGQDKELTDGEMFSKRKGWVFSVNMQV